MLGRTRDDAAGEAFDKVARILGLGYPGGPMSDRVAEQGRPGAITLPRPFPDEHSFDFSFSGLKTAVLRVATRLRTDAPDGGPDVPWVWDVALAFQESLVHVLTAKTARAARERQARSIVLAGGVAANSALRSRIAAAAAGLGVPLYLPPIPLCTDNAAMIAMAAAYRLHRGERSTLRLGAYADLDLMLPVPETGWF
jgi:N6-L-threonylcarbamoyladenine synthase